ncbi:E3 SUMO-protein ligase RanBP2, partial [Blyttiomyces sp. JEL0837]
MDSIKRLRRTLFGSPASSSSTTAADKADDAPVASERSPSGRQRLRSQARAEMSSPYARPRNNSNKAGSTAATPESKSGLFGMIKSIASTPFSMLRSAMSNETEDEPESPTKGRKPSTEDSGTESMFADMMAVDEGSSSSPSAGLNVPERFNVFTQSLGNLAATPVNPNSFASSVSFNFAPAGSSSTPVGQAEKGKSVVRDPKDVSPRQTYEELSQFFASKGDQPLTSEEAERLQKLIGKNTLESGSGSQGISTTDSTRPSAFSDPIPRPKDTIPQSSAPIQNPQPYFLPVFATSSQGPSLADQLSSTSTKSQGIMKRPTRKANVYFGASFGTNINPYKRRLPNVVGSAAFQPVRPIVQPQEESNAKKMRMDEPDISSFGDDSAARLILDTLEEMAPPPNKPLSFESTLAPPINPYEKTVNPPVTIIHQVPKPTPKGKNQALVREFTSSAMKSQPKSALLKAKLTHKTLEKPTGTPSKPPEQNVGFLAGAKRKEQPATSEVKFPMKSAIATPQPQTPAKVVKTMNQTPLAKAVEPVAEKSKAEFSSVLKSFAAESQHNKEILPAAPKKVTRIDMILAKVHLEPAESLPNFDFGTVKSSGLPNYERLLVETQSNLPVFSFGAPADKNFVYTVLMAESIHKGSYKMNGVQTSQPAKSISEAKWTCNTCLVPNEATALKCVACETSNPSAAAVKTGFGVAASTASPSPAGGFVFKPTTEVSNTGSGNLFNLSGASTGGKPLSGGFTAPAASGWTCDTCLVPNKADATKCVACETAKLQANTAKSAVLSASTPNPVGGFSFKPPAPAQGSSSGIGSPFSFGSSSGSKPLSGGFTAPSASGWDCDTCLVPNKAEAVKCVACETPKPQRSLAKPSEASSSSSAPSLAGGFSFKPPAPAQSQSSSGGAATTSVPVFGGFSAPAAAGWKCDTCLVPNKAEAAKCVACEAPKPQSKSADASSSTTNKPVFGGFSAPVTTGWTCDTCLVPNKAEATKCVSCETPKPQSKSVPQKWTCDTCLVPNEASASTCVACETVKPG